MIAANDTSKHNGAHQKGVAPEPDFSWAIEGLPEELIDDPLDYIFADHFRQRQAAVILTMIADGEFDKRGIENLLEFLQVDFVRHVADEELSFFPILREKCVPEDKMDDLLAKLIDEHKGDESLGDDVIGLLKNLITGGKLQKHECSKIRGFAEHIRTHLALENAVLLPIARVRMDPLALDILADMLKKRRQNEH